MRMLKRLSAIALKNFETRFKTNSSFRREMRDLVIIPGMKATGVSDIRYGLVCGGGAVNRKASLAINEAA